MSLWLNVSDGSLSFQSEIMSKNIPKKLRKGRAKNKIRSRPKPSAVKGVSQRRQSLPLPSKQAPAARSPIVTAERDERHRYVFSELKRGAIIGGALLILLIVLSILLR